MIQVNILASGACSLHALLPQHERSQAELLLECQHHVVCIASESVGLVLDQPCPGSRVPAPIAQKLLEAQQSASLGAIKCDHGACPLAKAARKASF